MRNRTMKKTNPDDEIHKTPRGIEFKIIKDS